MADFLVENNFLMSTSTAGVVQAAEDFYEPRAVFSINASNQLIGTLWVVKNGILMKNDIGTASYTVRDKDGNTIGITQSGMTADLNGLFKTTAVSATNILDLTHYTVHLEISADNLLRESVVAITIGD